MIGVRIRDQGQAQRQPCLPCDGERRERRASRIHSETGTLILDVAPTRARYASIHSHKHEELGRRDDLWSLLYMLLELHGGQLPWQMTRDHDEVRDANPIRMACVRVSC